MALKDDSGFAPFGGGASGGIVIKLPDHPTLYPAQPVMETIVRPFVVLDSAPRGPAQKARPKLPGADGPAFIQWGKASSFVQNRAPTDPVKLPNGSGEGQQGVTLEEPEEEDQATPPDATWTEVARMTEDVRVENPDDSNQYVIVQRVKEATFENMSGRRMRLRFRNGD